MKTYTRIIGGIEHTMQYADEDAKALIASGVELIESTATKQQPKPANKARRASNK